MLEEEDDPVDTEVDVYLCKTLSEHLYLVQHPLRPAHKAYDQPVISARFRPTQQRIEMEVALDTHSKNYDRSKGEQFALNADGGVADSDNRFYNSDKMDKQLLSSMPVGPEIGRYVIGLYRDHELHLTPLQGVLQMRPMFSYLDQSDSKQKTDAHGPGGGDGESSQDEGEEEAKPVMMKFARHETEEAKARRMASYEYLRKTGEAEAWVDLEHHKDTDVIASVKRGLLLSQQLSDTSGQFHISEGEYLKKLMPEVEEEAKERPALPSNVLSMTELKCMSLGDQVKALLLNAKVIRFSQLMTLLPKGTDATAALRCLQQVALLVQGCWVVKSETLYPKDTFSGHSGVPAETLCRGRDYIMWRFTQNRYLVRKDISSVIKLPAEDVKDMLEQMAKLKVNCGWEFLMECDQEFTHRHPEVVQRQNMLWEAKFQQLSTVLNISKADIKLAAAASAAATISPKRRRTMSRSRTKSGGMSDFSDTDGEVSRVEHHRKPSGNDGRKRHSSGPRQQRNNSVSDHIMLPPAVTSPSAMDCGSTSNGTMAVDSAELDKALNVFVQDRLLQRFVLTMSELRMLFNHHLAECPPGHILGSGVSDKRLEAAVYAAGGHRFQFTTPEGDIIFGQVRTGDSLDPIRVCLAEILDTKPSCKTAYFKRKLEEQGLELPSETEIKKVLKEFCISKGSNWQLKGCLPNS